MEPNHPEKQVSCDLPLKRGRKARNSKKFHPSARETDAGEPESTEILKTFEGDDPKILKTFDLAAKATDLQALIDAPPEEFRAAAARVLQAHLAIGLSQIAPPTTIREVVQLAAVWESMSGLKDKDKAQPGGLIAPLRTVSRRAAPPVDVETSE